ncbi:MAG: acetyl-CoA carboxylase biotin carboxyl carrier protein subunit [Eubacteriales bacterium]|nr:acetyl-CoA carboxylase biotin carboxyl carrier protein subunit [Eubacteriales bacterium]
MKTYTITVNGVAYEVTVEETAAGAAPAAAMPAMPRPAAQTAPMPAVPAAPAAAASASAGAGANRIEAGAAGKVFKIESKVGDQVKKGDTVIILEAMKMEIPMVSPVDGKVASIDCAVGDAVEAGTLLATVD